MKTRLCGSSRLLPHSLQNRLLVAYLALMLFGLGGLILWTGQRLAVAVVEETENHLELEALILSNAFRDSLESWAVRENRELETEAEDVGDVAGRERDTSRLIALVNTYARDTDGRITVTSGQLDVVVSSDARVPVHREIDHPEFVAARASRVLHDIRWDPWSAEERLFVAAPVRNEASGEPVGYLQLSLPMAPVYADIRQTWLNLAGAGAVILLVTALVSVLVARQITRPLRELTRITESLADGQFAGQVIAGDTQEIDRLGRAFNRMAEQVREMLATQRRFVADAAHELRTPLTGVRLRLEMLQTHGRGDPQLTQRYLAQMDQELRHLQRVVDHLLDLSSLDAAVWPRPAYLELLPLLNDLASEFAPLAQQAGLQFGTNLPATLPRLLANEEQMRIAVRNLLDNAIKYSPAGGRVTFGALVTADAVQISVADTGIGVSPEDLPHIFDRFYRADPARSRREGGTGLGLSLVRTIVDGMGGEIEVRSTPGAGSLFTLRLALD